MTIFRLFTTTVLLLSATSVKVYSVPYQGIRPAFSITPKLIYTSDPNPAFSGYSYTTQDFNGGESNVVFTTGADSMSKLKSEINLMKISEESSQTDEDKKNTSLKQQLKSEKFDENNKEQDLDSNVEVFNEKKKLLENSETDNNFIEREKNFKQVPLPYSVLKENVLNLYPLFSRYSISSNTIPTQYYPHDPYARLELPLHNFNFYNPVPLFYQATTIVSDSNSRPVSTAVENKNASTKNIAKSLQTDAINSESNLIKSNIVESTTHRKKEELPAPKSANSDELNNIESTTVEKIKEEGMTNKTAVISQNSTEQTIDNEVSSTEQGNAESKTLL
ncbi:hypothetical protein PUN28_014540 [Cardiocondyla obscurior]|uniref:Uncharacterized protein n=1 Tax=Cardiocondyla obscurior TaxID=286306 RepID=A0AAW2F5P5_9HYME